MFTLVGVVIAVLGWLRSARPAGPRPVDTLADLLAQAVGDQWRQEAARRMLVTPAPIPVGWSLSDLPVAGAVEAAVGTTGMAPAFLPLPGQTQVTTDQLLAGGGRGELFAVYAGIASGRMVVLGAPGAGKSGTAVMLLLDALNHRDHVDAKDRARVPVPVLFPAHRWDPTSCSAQDWLAARLAVDYPLFQHRDGQVEAADLVAAGAVTLILDGLDEMDLTWRSASLQALSDAPFRVTVLTRSREMIEAASTTYLVGAVAVQLHDVTGSHASDYLTRARTGPPPLGWTQLLTHLREHPDSDLTHALSTPLTLTLVRDTYQAGDDISELLDSPRFSTADDIGTHLISRVLPNAYTPHPGRPKPRYSLAQAHQALTFLARQMNQDHTRELAWWRIPRWAPSKPRILASMIASGLLGGLLGGLTFQLAAVFVVVVGGLPLDRLWRGFENISSHIFLLGLTFGLGVGLTVGLAYGRGGHDPKKIRNWRAISWRSVLTIGLTIGLTASLIAGLVVVLAGGPAIVLNAIPHRLFPLLLQELVNGLAIGFLLGLKHDLPRGLEGSGPQALDKSQRKDRVAGLVSGLVAGLLIGLVSGLLIGLVAGLSTGLVVVVEFRLVPRLVGGFVAKLALESAQGKSNPQRPLETWRNDRVFGLVAGVGIGLGLGLGTGFGNAILTGFKFGFRAALVVVLVNVILGGMLGLMYGIVSSARWPTTLAWFQLRLSGRIPTVDLMSLLEDARDRDVLRTVGAMYQFRHATLQDQLAGPTTMSPDAPQEAGAREPAATPPPNGGIDKLQALRQLFTTSPHRNIQIVGQLMARRR